MTTSSNNPKAQLRAILELHFNLSELQTLCQDLGVSYEQLAGSTRSDKARELIEYLDRRTRLPELVAMGKQLRPELVWPDLTGSSSGSSDGMPPLGAANGAKLRVGVVVVGLPRGPGGEETPHGGAAGGQLLSDAAVTSGVDAAADVDGETTADAPDEDAGDTDADDPDTDDTPDEAEEAVEDGPIDDFDDDP